MNLIEKLENYNKVTNRSRGKLNKWLRRMKAKYSYKFK